LATGQVKRINLATGKRVVVMNRRGQPQWNDVFENNPRIARRDAPELERLVNCGGARPYIAGKSPTHWVWKRWDIAPGEIYLTPAEREFGAHYAGRVLIEPSTKVRGSNKAWLAERWQRVVDKSGLSFVQVGPEGTAWLDGVVRVPTTFRQACAVLAASRAYLGPEGALHHAAAALAVPAVVLWSHFIDPVFTGYATQRNLRHADGWCGSRTPCPTCRRSMEAITVHEVIHHLSEVIA
jgi:ADP-heptose:LPS heptosyltransferase